MKINSAAFIVALSILVPASAQAACPALPPEAKSSGFLEMKSKDSTSKNGITTTGQRSGRSVSEGSVVYSAALKTLILCDGTGWIAIDVER
jgi:hypothetical protein